jgi:hypothetical protein
LAAIRNPPEILALPSSGGGDRTTSVEDMRKADAIPSGLCGAQFAVQEKCCAA